MSDSTVTLKKGDTGPKLEGQLRDRNGPVDLAGGQVRFYMRKRANGEILIDGRDAEITDEENGLVEVEWEETDTEVSQDLEAEFVVTWSDEKISFPNRGFILVRVKPGIRKSVENQ